MEIPLTSADGNTIKSAKTLDNGNLEAGGKKEFVSKAASGGEREDRVKLLQTFMDRKPVHKIIQRDGGYRKQPIELPPPLAEGWMRRRGENNTGWRLMYERRAANEAREKS